MLRKHPLIEVTDESPFANDKLQREKAVKALAGLIENAQTPFVLGVTGAWGTGKTTFVRMLEAVLRKQGHLCIHHNAWENDFADDPLVGLIQEIGGAIASVAPPEDATASVKGRFRKAKGKAKNLLHAAGPLLLQIATKGALTGEVMKHFAEIFASSGEDIAKAVSKYAEESLGRYQEARESIGGLREQLAELVRQISALEAEAKTPVVFVIDELDRCRPTYAIQLLERVKHIFNVPGIVFVLAIDRDQLCHSIKAVYGNEFDAEGYLRRFIDLGYRLGALSLEAFVYSIWEQMGLEETCRGSSRIEGFKTTFVKWFCPVAKSFGTSLREIEQTLSQVNVILRLVTPSRGVELGEFGLVCALRLTVPASFEAFVVGQESAEGFVVELRKRPLGKAWLESPESAAFEARLLAWSRVEGELQTKLETLSARAKPTPPDRQRQSRDGELLDWIQRFAERGRIERDSLGHYVSLFDLTEGFSSIA